jgi:hypothetical protein
MADCGEDYAALAEIVCPARDRLSAQVFTFADVSQAIDILTPQDGVLGIFVIRSLGDVFLKWQNSLKHHQPRAMP